jgi:hypothetical protein
MSNQNFLGTNLGITGLAIKGSRLIVDCSFNDADGLVHATARHEIVIGEHERLQTPANALLEAVVQHITRLHFRNPGTAEEQITHAGISETLRNAGTDIPEGFEEGS